MSCPAVVVTLMDCVLLSLLNFSPTYCEGNTKDVDGLRGWDLFYVCTSDSEV